ncbi:hypothetical protein G6F68_003892 [Rhizopus microsporus]|nr:hypothetical protein G6F68_003892 [Rhizopus microsporus]
MKHTEQKSYFDGVNITRVPILRQNLKRTASKSSENPPLKRPRLVPESPELLYNSFLRSIHDYIKATVDFTTKKSKNVERDLNKLEQKEHDDTEPEVAGESQLTSENDDDDGIEEEELITGNTTDLTRRRLCCLKSVLKSLLLDDRKDAFSIDDLKKECSDVEEKEAYPCLLILNALKPYIPKKKERFIIAHQLPFCILANGTLMYAGYKKFYRKLCPQPSASTLHALRIDGPSLYQILTRLPCALNNNSRDFSKDIKDLKAKWRNSSLEEKVDLYNAIEKVKDERNQSFLSVQAARDKLKLKRQLMHFKRVAMKQKPAITHETAHASQSSNTQWHVVQKYGHGITKVEDCRLSPQVNPSEEFIFSGTDNGLKTMTSTVPLIMKRFKFHLELRNKYKALEDTNGCKEEAPKIVSKYSSNESRANSFLQLPSSMAIKAGDIDIGSGYYNVRRKLEKSKEVNRRQSKSQIETNVRNAKRPLSKTLVRKRKSVFDRQERRYGEKWRQCMHGMNINVCITNENVTSQTCMYCFSKLDHPIYRKIDKDKDIRTKVKGSFLCRNSDCVLISNKKAIKSRDNLSALAIGLSGLCNLLFQETFPELSAKISHCNTEFINKTASFLNAREYWDTGHDASNRDKSKTFEKKGS